MTDQDTEAVAERAQPTLAMIHAGIHVLNRHHVDAYGEVKLYIVREIWEAMTAMESIRVDKSRH